MPKPIFVVGLCSATQPQSIELGVSLALAAYSLHQPVRMLLLGDKLNVLSLLSPSHPFRASLSPLTDEPASELSNNIDDEFLVLHDTAHGAKDLLSLPSKFVAVSQADLTAWSRRAYALYT